MDNYSQNKEQLEIELLKSEIKSNQIKHKLSINILQAIIAIFLSVIASCIYEKTYLSIEEKKKNKISQSLDIEISALNRQKEQVLTELNDLRESSEKLKSKKAVKVNSEYPGVHARVEHIGHTIKLLLTITGKNISDVKAYVSNNNELTIIPGITNDLKGFKDSIATSKITSNEKDSIYIYSIGPFMNIVQNEPIWIIIQSENTNYIYTVTALTK